MASLSVARVQATTGACLLSWEPGLPALGTLPLPFPVPFHPISAALRCALEVQGPGRTLQSRQQEHHGSSGFQNRSPCNARRHRDRVQRRGTGLHYVISCPALCCFCLLLSGRAFRGAPQALPGPGPRRVARRPRGGGSGTPWMWTPGRSAWGAGASSPWRLQGLGPEM